jgi:hypothetical protein
MNPEAAAVIRRDPSAEAVIAVLRASARRGVPWVPKSEVAARAGISLGQAHGALLQLAVDGIVTRGLVDSGNHLSVCWRLQPSSASAATASPRRWCRSRRRSERGARSPTRRRSEVGWTGHRPARIDVLRASQAPLWVASACRLPPHPADARVEGRAMRYTHGNEATGSSCAYPT